MAGPSVATTASTPPLASAGSDLASLPAPTSGPASGPLSSTEPRFWSLHGPAADDSSTSGSKARGAGFDFMTAPQSPLSREPSRSSRPQQLETLARLGGPRRMRALKVSAVELGRLGGPARGLAAGRAEEK